MMSFLLMLLVPVAVSGVAFLVFKATITWKEFLLSLGVSVGVVVVGWQIAKWGSMQSTEHLNGRITRKVEGTQSCCHCRTVCDKRNKKGECTSEHEECDHSRDYYWDLETTVGTIPVDNCSGSSFPPSVWTNAVKGEPASVSHGYTNYLLADKDSLYAHAPMARYEASIPDYPQIHGLYKVSHVVGLSAPRAFAEAMREMNADLGATNQVDITVVLTAEQSPEFAQALEAKWLYGPKNSLNIVMGMRGDTIQWVRVVTFSKVEMLKVRLRDNLQGLSINDPEVPRIIRSEVSTGFRRTAMADFAYLASTAAPEGWTLALLFVFEVLACALLTYWVHVKDVFGDERFLISSEDRFAGRFRR